MCEWVLSEWWIRRVKYIWECMSRHRKIRGLHLYRGTYTRELYVWYIYIHICMYVYESSWADIGRYLLYIYEKETTKETCMKRDLLALSLKPQLLKRDIYKRTETNFFQNWPTTGTHMYKERPTCIRETFFYEKIPTSIKETHKRDLHLEKDSYRKDLHLCRKKALYTRTTWWNTQTKQLPVSKGRKQCEPCHTYAPSIIQTNQTIKHTTPTMEDTNHTITCEQRKKAKRALSHICTINHTNEPNNLTHNPHNETHEPNNHLWAKEESRAYKSRARLRVARTSNEEYVCFHVLCAARFSAMQDVRIYMCAGQCRVLSDLYTEITSKVCGSWVVRFVSRVQSRRLNLFSISRDNIKSMCAST